MTIPFRERISCSVREALELTGFGKTQFYEMMGTGKIDSVKVGGKRLVKVKSLLQLLGEKWEPNPQNYPQNRRGFTRTGTNRHELRVTPKC